MGARLWRVSGLAVSLPGSLPMASIASSATVAFLLVVALDGGHDEHEREDAEDEGLDGVEHELQAVQRDRDEGDGQGQ